MGYKTTLLLRAIACPVSFHIKCSLDLDRYGRSTIKKEATEFTFSMIHANFFQWSVIVDDFEE